MDLLLEPGLNSDSDSDTFFYIGSHATQGTAKPEASYHTPFLPSGGGALLQVALEGHWTILRCVIIQQDLDPMSVGAFVVVFSVG